MGKLLSFLKLLIQRHGTKVSPLAILHDVNCDNTTAIYNGPLVKTTLEEIIVNTF